MGNFLVNSEMRSSEEFDAAFTDLEPAVLSYAQFRNRECLRAWRRRYQQLQAPGDENGTRDLKWWSRAHG